MFEDNGRVKAIRLKNELSEGFILPAVQFQNYIMSVTNKEVEVEAGIEFDIVEHEGKEFWINKKYIPKRQQGQGGTPRNNQTKKVKGISKVIDEQFRFHYDRLSVA